MAIRAYIEQLHVRGSVLWDPGPVRRVVDEGGPCAAHLTPTCRGVGGRADVVIHLHARRKRSY